MARRTDAIETTAAFEQGRFRLTTKMTLIIALANERTPQEHVIAIRGLRHSYDGPGIRKGLDLDVPRGRVVGLLGKNGVGKATLNNILMGLTWGLDSGCKAVGRQLKALKESLIKSHPDQVDAASNLNYWIKMEEALHVFLSKDYDRALKKYKRLLDDYEDRYVLHFRIGEICFIESNITQALRAFDASERLIHAAMIRKPGCRILMQNMAIIKRKLSYAYWMLGDEYIDKSIALMQDVEKLLVENHESFDNYDQHVVLTYNNLCWYMTCKWQACLKEWKALNGVSGDARHGKCLSLQGDAKDFFEKLVDAIESNKSKGISVPSNCLDTAAFFCYLMSFLSG